MSSITWKSFGICFLALQLIECQLFISWESGDSAGSKVGSASNPSGRANSGGWVVGNTVYIFGGIGNPPTAGDAHLNDFWQYNSTSWYLLSGSTTPGAAGNYGPFGQSNPTYTPGARKGVSTWTDLQGNLWLYGGEYGANASQNIYNDLWQFSKTGWAWQGGSSTNVNVPGSLSLQGQASSSNLPGSKSFASSWRDVNGNLWLFGGITVGASTGPSNDLWSYNISSGLWTWIAGNDTGVAGIYGVQGVPSSSNYPGGRHGAATAIDINGNVWLFGGYGYDQNGNLGLLNDLWFFNGTVWTWVHGNTTIGITPFYQHSTTTPQLIGARVDSSAWVDNSNVLWIFGGYGIDVNSQNSYLSDFWLFDGKNWDWSYGPTGGNQPGIYGTKHVSYIANEIGSRSGATLVFDTINTVWLFAGQGYDSTTFGYLNDLWKISTVPSFAPTQSDSRPNADTNWKLPLIVFALGGIVCILIAVGFGIAIHRSRMAKRMEAHGHPEPKKADDPVQLDDLNVED